MKNVIIHGKDLNILKDIIAKLMKKAIFDNKGYSFKTALIDSSISPDFFTNWSQQLNEYLPSTNYQINKIIFSGMSLHKDNLSPKSFVEFVQNNKHCQINEFEFLNVRNQDKAIENAFEALFSPSTSISSSSSSRPLTYSIKLNFLKAKVSVDLHLFLLVVSQQPDLIANLSLINFSFDDRSFEQLINLIKKAGPSLKSLDLSFCKGLNEASILKLVETLGRKTKLTLFKSSFEPMVKNDSVPQNYLKAEVGSTLESPDFSFSSTSVEVPVPTFKLAATPEQQSDLMFLDDSFEYTVKNNNSFQNYLIEGAEIIPKSPDFSFARNSEGVSVTLSRTHEPLEQPTNTMLLDNSYEYIVKDKNLFQNHSKSSVLQEIAMLAARKEIFIQGLPPTCQMIMSTASAFDNMKSKSIFIPRPNKVNKYALQPVVFFDEIMSNTCFLSQVSSQDSDFVQICAAGILTKEYLENNFEMVNKPGNNGFYPLMYAAERGHIDTVKLLINCDVSGSSLKLVNINNVAKGYTALLLASKAEKWEIVSILLEAGAAVEASASEGIDAGKTAFWYAVNYKAPIEIINKLLDKHPAINAVPLEGAERGLPALWFAAYNKNWTLVSSLLNHNPLHLDSAPQEEPYKDINVLWMAADDKQWEIVSQLLSLGAVNIFVTRERGVNKDLSVLTMARENEVSNIILDKMDKVIILEVEKITIMLLKHKNRKKNGLETNTAYSSNNFQESASFLAALDIIKKIAEYLQNITSLENYKSNDIANIIYCLFHFIPNEEVTYGAMQKLTNHIIALPSLHACRALQLAWIGDGLRGVVNTHDSFRSLAELAMLKIANYILTLPDLKRYEYEVEFLSKIVLNLVAIIPEDERCSNAIQKIVGHINTLNIIKPCTVDELVGIIRALHEINSRAPWVNSLIFKITDFIIDPIPFDDAVEAATVSYLASFIIGLFSQFRRHSTHISTAAYCHDFAAKIAIHVQNLPSLQNYMIIDILRIVHMLALVAPNDSFSVLLIEKISTYIQTLPTMPVSFLKEYTIYNLCALVMAMNKIAPKVAFAYNFLEKIALNILAIPDLKIVNAECILGLSNVLYRIAPTAEFSNKLMTKIINDLLDTPILESYQFKQLVVIMQNSYRLAPRSPSLALWVKKIANQMLTFSSFPENSFMDLVFLGHIVEWMFPRHEVTVCLIEKIALYIKDVPTLGALGEYPLQVIAHVAYLVPVLFSSKMINTVGLENAVILKEKILNNAQASLLLTNEGPKSIGLKNIINTLASIAIEADKTQKLKM